MSFLGFVGGNMICRHTRKDPLAACVLAEPVLLSQMKGLFACVVLMFFIITTHALASSDLRLVVLLHRHGDRAPIYQMPTISQASFQQDFPLGYGELTGLGMSQLYQLGLKLKRQYVGSFLGQNWNANDYLVRSTDIHRTLQSAQAVLYAMFPPGTGPNDTIDNTPALPGNFQPIPISTVSLATDSLLIGHDYADANCPHYQQFINDLYKTQAFAQKSAELAPLLSAITAITNFTTTMDTLIFPFDSFICYKAHKILQERFPGVTDDMFQQMAQTYVWIIQQLTSSPQINCLTSGPLVQEILQHVRDASSSTSSSSKHSASGISQKLVTPLSTLGRNNVGTAYQGPKFVHYSAHDTTVWPLLAALLQEFDWGQPAYAAHVVIELHQADSGTYFVRTFYNDSQILLPYCNGKLDCDVQLFIDYLSKCGTKVMEDNPLCGAMSTTAQLALLKEQVTQLQGSLSDDDAKVKRLAIAAGCMAALAVILMALLFFCLRWNEIKRRNEAVGAGSYTSLATADA